MSRGMIIGPTNVGAVDESYRLGNAPTVIDLPDV